jgi:hypothetical protein
MMTTTGKATTDTGVTGKVVFPMDFVRITNDKLADDGLFLDDIVFVQHTKAFPLTEEDPYTQRVKFIVRRVTSVDKVELSDNAFMIDPASVERISDEGNVKLFKLLEERLAEEYATTD